MTTRVALTFDAEHPDRPDCAPGVADAMVDALHDRGVRATFFLQGRWVEAYPQTARRILQAGHLIGNHSYYHARMPLLSETGLVADVSAAEHVIRELGADPRPWFRYPWGEGWSDPALSAALTRMGYRHVGWDVVPRDWERSHDEIETAVVGGVLNGHDERVVILHAWPEQTLRALPRIIGRLEDGDTTFVAIDEIRRVPVAGAS
jgi:peptidoglycan/xylan/chitin deacetylase (PgdA/CDA1 family)